MLKKTSQIRELKTGDLVYHLLYGKKWVGILLEIIPPAKEGTRETAKVLMHPGTKYYLFFEKNVSKKNRISDNMGYVATNWLFKLEELKGV